MSIRIQKTFEALFALEEVRGLFRESLPTGFDPGEEAAFRQKIALRISRPAPVHRK